VFNRVLIAGLMLCACSPQAPKSAATAAAPIAPSTPSATPSLTLTDPQLAQLDGIAPKTKVSSPLHITGLAPGNWFFEGSFPVTVTDVYGEKLGEAPARPTEVSWTDPDPVKKFEATITFETRIEQEGMIILEEDMPGQDDKGDDKPPRRIKLPVMLTPSK
jgi:hypothetical protein